jgi:hypothetical protein
VQKVSIGFHAAGATRQHQAVHHRACLRTGDGVAVQPGFSSGDEWPDVALLST